MQLVIKEEKSMKDSSGEHFVKFASLKDYFIDL